ncbi:hypothetical protein J1614_009138 [Plenodomus biglobosus]|nr:hypothetical protein J1614_009138 [Plenodomus biglobosus]
MTSIHLPYVCSFEHPSTNIRACIQRSYLASSNLARLSNFGGITTAWRAVSPAQPALAEQQPRLVPPTMPESPDLAGGLPAYRSQHDPCRITTPMLTTREWSSRWHDRDAIAIAINGL